MIFDEYINLKKTAIHQFFFMRKPQTIHHFILCDFRFTQPKVLSKRAYFQIKGALHAIPGLYLNTDELSHV
jgi:hypothetical protein